MTAVQLGCVVDLKTGTYGTFTAELYRSVETNNA